jgi:hypothetical protein
MRVNLIILFLDNRKASYLKMIQKSFLIIKNNFIEYLKFFPFFIILEGIFGAIFMLIINLLNLSMETFFIKLFFLIIIFPVYIFYKYFYLFFFYNITSYPQKQNFDFINEYLIVK